jgi:branched-chain amino acid aminotransferase
MDDSLLSKFRVERAPNSRLSELNSNELGFGNIFSDHMFSMRFSDGAWHTPEVVPYGPITLEPSCVTLHYGQSVFEGLKAFRGVDHQIRTFRRAQNDKRLANSCARLCIPHLPEGALELAVRELIALDHAWVPSERGQALYIRPLIFAEESHLEVRPAVSYRFLVMTAPVRTYYANGFGAVGLKVQDEFTRAAPGGVGYAKTAGNYAASLLPGNQSRNEGFDQALWLDGAEHKYVEEVGQMNIFFEIDGRLVTPELRGTILPGVTRDSVITLLRARGHAVDERRIEIAEIIEGIKTGSVTEAFGAGTAAAIAPIGRIGYKGETHLINNNAAGPVAQTLYDEMLGIQLGELADKHGWTELMETEPASAAAD